MFVISYQFILKILLFRANLLPHCCFAHTYEFDMPAIMLLECGRRHTKGCVHSFADSSRTCSLRTPGFILAGGDYPLQNLFWHQYQQSLPDFKFLLRLVPATINTAA
jgi:hypothetical protein